MVNPNAAGTTGETFEMDIERGKIREFAAATGSQHPAYLAENPPIPPTFLTTQIFWAGDQNRVWEAVEMDQQRGLHAEQEFIFHGPPPRAGVRLSATSRIDQIYTKQGKRGGELTFAVMVTEFRDHDGHLVAESRLTGVETGRPPAASTKEQ
ncbi:dehydratase [Enemella dayhoffiae]|uniref:Dehydratase n=1 Tax=Enemella dayhoffiae TaxID=2016507 RepID=A0A255GME0_9ACTN|nr:MaoC family dehydratase N-terminal domain-containing protein [Enemella dayhoffiae]OYO16562.1 dehydratase [Enemella dayhoffiae]